MAAPRDAGRGVRALARLRRRRGRLVLLLLPFLLVFSSTRIYCENCRYTSIPGFTAAGAPRPADLTGGGCCCARTRGGAGGGGDVPPSGGSVQHKRSPVCIAKHVPLQEGSEAPAVAPALARIAGSDDLPLPALHEAEASFPRTSRAPPA